jgi:hypothetical protein
MNYNNIKLNFLRHEWLNFDDHDATRWIAAINAKIELKNAEKIAKGERQRPHLDAVEIADWRARFAETRKAFVYLQDWKWHQVLAWVLGRIQDTNGNILDGITRRAENALFVGAFLRLYDDRPCTAIHLERIIGIDTGHAYRTLRRGGVAFRVSQQGERQLRSLEETEIEAFGLRYFPVPRHDFTLFQGRMVRDFDPEHKRFADDVMRPPLLLPPRIISALKGSTR